MTGFVEKLGTTMILSVANRKYSTKEQIRAAVTTYCILFDVKVESKEWDDLIIYIYHHYNRWFDSYKSLNDYMSDDLL